MTVYTDVTREEILDLLPHREPFLFVDRVLRLEIDRHIVAEWTVRPEEPWFTGHFPGRPILPGVLVTDALAQVSGLLWGLSRRRHAGGRDDGVPRMFFLAAANMKYPSPALPGETLTLTSTADRTYGTLFSYSVEATVGRRTVARGTLTLALSEGVQTV